MPILPGADALMLISANPSDVLCHNAGKVSYKTLSEGKEIAKSIHEAMGFDDL